MNRQHNHHLYQITALILMLFLATHLQAQSCDSTVLPTAADSSYTNNADGTVTDLQTGLMWMQCLVGLNGAGCATGSASTFTWDVALQQPQTLNNNGGFANYTDWRLPNIKELESLVEYACWNPSINIKVFPNTPSTSSFFWSSSPSHSQSNTWLINFYFGHTIYTNRLERQYVRLVRGAGQ